MVGEMRMEIVPGVRQIHQHERPGGKIIDRNRGILGQAVLGRQNRAGRQGGDHRTAEPALQCQIKGQRQFDLPRGQSTQNLMLVQVADIDLNAGVFRMKRPDQFGRNRRVRFKNDPMVISPLNSSDNAPTSWRNWSECG